MQLDPSFPVRLGQALEYGMVMDWVWLRITNCTSHYNLDSLNVKSVDNILHEHDGLPHVLHVAVHQEWPGTPFWFLTLNGTLCTPSDLRPSKSYGVGCRWPISLLGIWSLTLYLDLAWIRNPSHGMVYCVLSIVYLIIGFSPSLWLKYIKHYFFSQFCHYMVK